MSHKTKWQKAFIILILVILLTNSCNKFYKISPSTPSPASNSINTPSPSLFKPGDPTTTPLGSDIMDPNFINGLAAFDADDDQEAIRLMSAVIKSNPNLAPPYRYRGVAYLSLGDCQSGLADEKKAVSINPYYAAALGARGALYGCLGKHEQELEDYQKALSIDPSLAFVHHNIGVYYFKTENYEKSLEEYSLSVEIDPNRSGAWSGKAEALTKLGRFDECIISATKAIEINAKEWLAYTDRGLCENFIGDNRSAIVDFKTFLEHYPNDAMTWYNLGTAQHQSKLSEEAIVSLSKALELNPSYYPANINRGLEYTNLGKYDEALDDFNHALEYGKFPAAYSGRGTVYYLTRKYNEAIADMELVTQMMPEIPHSYCILAHSYFEVGKYQDALDAAQKIHEIAPECEGQMLFEEEAQSYYKLGQYEQGIAYITTVFDDRGQIYDLGYYYRGIMYASLAKNQEAIKDLEFFLRMRKDIEVVYKNEAANAKKILAKLNP